VPVLAAWAAAPLVVQPVSALQGCRPQEDPQECPKLGRRHPQECPNLGRPQVQAWAALLVALALARQASASHLDHHPQESLEECPLGCRHPRECPNLGRPQVRPPASQEVSKWAPLLVVLAWLLASQLAQQASVSHLDHHPRDQESLEECPLGCRHPRECPNLGLLASQLAQEASASHLDPPQDQESLEEGPNLGCRHPQDQERLEEGPHRESQEEGPHRESQEEGPHRESQEEGPHRESQEEGPNLDCRRPQDQARLEEGRQDHRESQEEGPQDHRESQEEGPQDHQESQEEVVSLRACAISGARKTLRQCQ